MLTGHWKLLKKIPARRKTLTYTNPGLISGKGSIHTVTSVPVNVQIGGSTVFVLNVEQFEKF